MTKPAIPRRVKLIFWLHVFAPRRFIRWHMRQLDKATSDLLLAYMMGGDQ